MMVAYSSILYYTGDHKICGPNNLIIHPGINSRSSGGHACQTNDSPDFAFNEFIGNQCITWDGEPYTFSGSPLDQSRTPFTRNNTFYSPNATFSYGGQPLAALQKVGLDLGSTVKGIPTPAEMVAMGKAVLGVQ